MIERYIKHIRVKCDLFLKQTLSHDRGRVSSAVRYAVFSGGKRFRPILFLATFESLGGKINKNVMSIAVCIEFIHTFSLIQDDLPSMDNDNYRRGILTVHKVFGEDMAVLASDYLLNEAYRSVLENNFLDSQLKVKILLELIKSVRGLVAGQEKDLQLVNKRKISPAKLDDIYLDKAGTLIAACINIAAILRGLRNIRLNSFNSFARKLGLAYQILDDILNVVGNKKLFKGRILSDRKRSKITYPSIYGIDRSKDILTNLIKQAKNDIKEINMPGEKLVDLCDFILKRTH